MTHALAFLAGIVTPWVAQVVIASARQARDLWRSPDYYLDDPFNYDGLYLMGRVLARAARWVKRRRSA